MFSFHIGSESLTQLMRLSEILGKYFVQKYLTALNINDKKQVSMQEVQHQLSIIYGQQNCFLYICIWLEICQQRANVSNILPGRHDADNLDNWSILSLSFPKITLRLSNLEP